MSCELLRDRYQAKLDLVDHKQAAVDRFGDSVKAVYDELYAFSPRFADLEARYAALGCSAHGLEYDAWEAGLLPLKDV
jgi:hypothetical protein